MRVTRHFVPWSVRRSVVIAHATDLHFGWSTPNRVLERAISAIRDSSPDVVVLTGDYVNVGLVHIDRLRRFAAALPGTIVATLGNHDHWAGAKTISRTLDRAGAVVLRNQNIEVRGEGYDLEIVGIDDARTRNDDAPRAFHGVRRPADALVLSHCPAASERISEHGGRLILSGHTHGGQFAVPRLTDALARAAGQPYVSGHYHVGGRQLYVNAGLGHSRRGMRGGATASAEVAIFSLVPAGPAPATAPG